ncbi:MAG: sensor histidine kinase [Candidatus Promineifilaceae bacterium]
MPGRDRERKQPAESGAGLLSESVHPLDEAQQPLTRERYLVNQTAVLQENVSRLEREIAERKRVEAALRASEAKYRTLVERLPAIVYLAERIGVRQLLYVSPQVEALLGYPAERWTADPNLWLQALHPEDRARVLEAAAGARNFEGAGLALEYRMIGQDGRVRWFRDEAEAAPDESGRRTVLHGLMLDVTEQREDMAAVERRNAELAALNSALLAHNEELNAFSHTVAHNLKNPLSILLGFAEMLAHDHAIGDEAAVGQALDAIREHGQRLERIINELLLLAEVRQRDEIPRARLDMGAVAQESLRRLEGLAQQRDVEISLPESWPAALGHRPWVEEMWVNYLSNAIKYAGRGARIALGADPPRVGLVRFWVRDDGPGIAPADQQRLFTPFTQLHRVEAQGHGLGLSIVQRIASKLGGTVGVESEPGQGSLFWFSLPAA